MQVSLSMTAVSLTLHKPCEPGTAFLLPVWSYAILVWLRDFATAGGEGLRKVCTGTGHES